MKQTLLWSMWDYCKICSRRFPVGQLTKQKGLFRCNDCWDNLDIERRERIISEKLADTREAEIPKYEKAAEDDVAELEW